MKLRVFVGLFVLLSVFGGCGTTRPWMQPKTGPPTAGEEDVRVTLSSGEAVTYRVAWGRMKEVEPGIYTITEPREVRFRISELPVFGIEVAPLSGSHRLRCEYDHPEVIDASGKRRTHMALPGVAAVGPESRNVTHYNALDFGAVDERWRVPGEWTFSVYEGETLIKTVTFTVSRD